MSKTLILHIGMPKTGTTSIQNFFGENQGLLSSYKTVYPRERPYNHSLTFAPIFSNHPQNSLLFKRENIKDKECIQKKIDELSSYWKKQFKIANNQTLVISAEALTNYSPEEVRKLYGFCKNFFSSIKAIVYVRHPHDAIRSQFGQNIEKVDGNSNSLAELLNETISKYSYEFIYNWESVLGPENVIVRPYSREHLLDNDVVSDFLACLNIESPSIPAASRKNTSFGRNAMAFLYSYNKQYPLFIDNKLNAERGLKNRLNIFYNLLLSAKDTPYKETLSFTEEQIEAINGQIELINSRLAVEHKFDNLESGNKKNSIPEFSEIPASFFVELINEYNKYIEKLLESRFRSQIELVDSGSNKYLRKLFRSIRHILLKMGIFSKQS